MVRILVGPEGLRHWWRFFFFALAVWLAGRFVEVPVSNFLAQRLGIDPIALSAPAVIISELVSLAEVSLVTGLPALLERRRIDEYGLRFSQAFGSLFWKGGLAGLLMVVFVGGAMILIGAMKIDGWNCGASMPSPNRCSG